MENDHKSCNEDYEKEFKNNQSNMLKINTFVLRIIKKLNKVVQMEKI